MSRVIPAFEQFFDKNGNPLAYGSLEFLEPSSTDSHKDTFSDDQLSTPNKNPLPLDGEGRCPDVFGTGAYNVILRDSNNLQIDQKDPVEVFSSSGGSQSGQFLDWNTSITYTIGDWVKGSDERYYRSTVINNTSNDPTSGGDEWEQGWLQREWNTNTTYDINDPVQYNGKSYISIKNANQGNLPTDTNNWSISDLDENEANQLYLRKDNNLSDLTNATTARTNLGLGTSATQDIVTSSTDTTGGRVLTVGFRGIGRESIVASSDLNTETFAGFGSITASTLNKPTGLLEGTFFTSAWKNANGSTQIATDIVNGSMHFRYENDTAWQPWEEIWHTGNFDLGAQGLTGSEATAIIKRADDSNVGVQNSTAYADFNDITLNGMFRVNAGSANAPTAQGFQVFNTSTNTTLKTQLAGEWGSTLRMFGRSQNVSWGDWEEFTHSGNLVGTVTQGGATVIERGSNISGEYVKYADGTVFMWKRNLELSTSAPSSYTNAQGITLYYVNGSISTLPTSCIPSESSVVISVRDLGGAGGVDKFGVTAGGTVNTSTTISINQESLVPTNVVNSSGMDIFIAGRWF